MIPFIAKLATSLPSIGWALAIGGFFMVAGIGVQQKVLNPKPETVDYSEIRGIVRDVVKSELKNIPKPEPTVPIQPFDVDKIKNLKTFTYSPNFSGNVAVNGIDSAAVHRWVEHSVMIAFEKHVVKDKKKRK